MSRAMKDSGIEWIGEIPSHWRVIKTKNKFTYKKEIVGNRVDLYERLSLTLNGVLRRSKDDTIGLQPQKFEGYQVLSKEELVFKLIDLENINTSRVGLSKFRGIVSPAYIVLSNPFESAFGYYYFYSMWQREVFNLIGGDGVRSALNKGDLLKIPYLDVPDNEKDSIVDYLHIKVTRINKIMRKTRSIIEDYKLLKQSIITEAVTKGLDKNVEMKDSGVDWIGGMPNHWQLSKLKYEFRIKKEIAGTEGYDVLSVTQNGLKVKDITMNEGQMAADYSKYQFVKVGDYVMNHMDLLTGWVDYSAFNGVTSPDYRVFYMTNSEKNSPEYYKYIFQSCYKNKVFYGLAQGVSNLGRWRLQADKFLNFYIPIPPKEEQDKITDYIISEQKRYDEIISKKEMLLLELEQYKKSLIYEYVTGKKQVE